MTPLLGRSKVDRQTHGDSNTTRKREQTESDTSTGAAGRRRMTGRYIGIKRKRQRLTSIVQRQSLK